MYLHFPEMEERFHDPNLHAEKGTCEWLLTHGAYQRWLQGSGDLLWTKGNPGTGKSTLLKYLLTQSELRRESLQPQEKHNELTISFFFHGRGTVLQKTAIGFYRFLLFQLLDRAPNLMSDLVDDFSKKAATRGPAGIRWNWSEGELLAFIRKSLPRIMTSRRLWIFIDVLDECGEDTALEFVEEVSSWLTELSAVNNRPCFHVCITCRHYPIIGKQTELEIYVERENKDDIVVYIENKLKKWRLQNKDLEKNLIEKADGIFLGCPRTWTNKETRFGGSSQHQKGKVRGRPCTQRIERAIQGTFGEFGSRLQI